jgi:hypothetical protein
MELAELGVSAHEFTQFHQFHVRRREMVFSHFTPPYSVTVTPRPEPWIKVQTMNCQRQRC